ncbi:MAG TPA: hypothetical protein VGS97_03295 [Actinocrinis sp.]|uniref:hypothetical protein n=1 Tax=Actinocrinis sp. TaxID=1920516 RepID=UPI002DDD75EB|nr:hypothetical protein [Actinocrinis sp.]HEV2343092.1 hypothetical protein [Actinocrinis sp.]
MIAASTKAVRQARAIARICGVAAAGWIALAVAISAGLLAVFPSPTGLPLVALVVGLCVFPLVRFARIVPPLSPTVHPENGSYGELLLAVRQVTAALGVSEPVGLELSPDCDAWLEPRPGGPVLVIGAPFLWWLRVSELRGLLAPVLAGMDAAHDTQIGRARRLVRRLDIAESRGCPPWPRPFVATVAASCRIRAEVMERAIGAAAAERARIVEPASRVYAHEQAGLVAVGWDRLLTRLAMPAWRRGYAPETLNAALVAALTELGERDRVGLGLADRLTERPACDLLDEPGLVDHAVSALAPQVYYGRPVDRILLWSHYVATVAEPALRAEAADAPDHPLIAKVRAQLDAHARPHGPGELAAGLRAVVQCGLADQGLAVWDIDWLDGVILRDRAGHAVPVDELVHGLLDNADFAALRDWITYASSL